MKHIAVIGSGISGLAAAYLLSRRHRVTLFERDDRLGGHTHTVVVDTPSGPVPLDTGFLVHNERTYPNLVRLFKEIAVETVSSDMSFSVSCEGTGFEYSSRGVAGFFAQPRSVVRPSHYRLLADIVRFNRAATRVLTTDGAESWTLSDYLHDQKYSEGFIGRYLAPMTSAVWSSSLDGVLRFPVRTLVRFMQNHGMLSIASHPTWRVVRGGSRSYIPALIAPLGNAVHTGAQLVSVRRDELGVDLTFANRPSLRVDDVVFACHGDQVLPLLADPSDAEREVFRQFTTTPNVAWLHTDRSALPVSVRARASWNYRLGGAPDDPPSVTYHLNRLQGIPGGTEYCVTLNPRSPIAADRVIRRIEYRHPLFTPGSVAAQGRWPDVSGARRTHYCGAYWRYGFHEDGLVSAIHVARDLGGVLVTAPPAPGLYVGTIRHRRFQPKAHAFEYSIFMALLDVDRLRECMQVSRFTSYNRRNWASFDERDHFGDPSKTLRERLRQSAAASGETLPDGPVFLLTHLRYAGYVFNPISLYYCYGTAGELELVLAEVNNTYGGRRNYWLRPGADAGHGFRARVSKSLYVSPFMEPEVDYEFALTPPGASLVAHMNVMRQNGEPGFDGRMFDATLTLERRPWTAASVRAALVRFPLMTAKVIAAIHWQALRLRLKGLAVMPFASERP